MEPVNPMTHCTYCRSPLSYDEKRNCKICLTCHPPQKEQPALVKEKKEDPDLKIIKDRIKKVIKEVVPDMIRDELENWHIQKSPIAKGEIEKIDTSLRTDWRQRAKELGINTFQMSKKDVLARIEEESKKQLDGVGNK